MTTIEPKFIPLDFERLDPDVMVRAGREFLDRMWRRRSVRHFTSEPPPKECIDLAIRTACSAPSGANRQPWRFVIVDDRDLKRQIRIAAEKEEKESYEHRFPQEWKDALAPLGTDWRKPFLETAPVLVVVFKETYGRDDRGRKVTNYYVNESVGLACGLFIAAIHSMGLATVTHTPSPMGFLAELLERPANEKPYILFPVGYPADDAKVPDISRKTLDEVVQWNRGE
ncbi:MAG: nitroreductase family protein [Gemmatimonadetes bacterium]|nr:nitroreductase family protein [Gemmatimonadota bacterium]